MIRQTHGSIPNAGWKQLYKESCNGAIDHGYINDLCKYQEDKQPISFRRQMFIAIYFFARVNDACRLCLSKYRQCSKNQNQTVLRQIFEKSLSVGSNEINAILLMSKLKTYTLKVIYIPV